MKSHKTGGTDLYLKFSKLNKVVLSFVFVIGAIFKANASDISALNFNGDLLGKVIPDGSVVNLDNEIIGNITADGFVIDDKKDVIGGIVPQGVAISYTNSVLGKVNNDGSVTAQNDVLVGKVLPNGIVVNDNYDVLGSVISQGLVFNDKGKIVGRVSGDGYFYDLKGSSSGIVSSDGYVYIPSREDNRFELSGRLMTSKIVVSFYGKFLGSVAPDGKVFDLKKNVIGNLYANGYVYNKDKQAIGHVVNGGYAFDFNGNYLGIISYNGEVIDKGVVSSYSVNENRIVNKDGKVIGFRIDFDAICLGLDGKFLGYVIPRGYVVKGRTVVGKINASGDVVDTEGKQIGVIASTGPIFDYLGKIKGNASIGGKVISLDGLEQGYMQKDRAFDFKGRQIGQTLSTRLVFNKSNQYLGISGIDTQIEKDTQVYTISPYGYVFNNSGEVVGNNIKFSGIYAPEGNIITYTSAQGNTENISLGEISKLDSNGILIDKNNKILGKTNIPLYATDFMGADLGYISPINTIIDNQNKRISKILPNNTIIDMNGNISLNQKAGRDYISISINGDFLGTNLLKGTVESDKQIIGKISSDDYVIDNLGALYGTPLPFATAITKDCKYLGVVSTNGEVRSSQNAYIGMVLSNGQVLNDSEEVIGHIISPSILTDDKGEVLGTTNTLGNALNYQNQALGCQDKRGFIKNSQDEIIAKTVKFSTVMSFDNKIIGYTDISGKILDISGVQLASSNLQGDIISKEGENLGVLFKYSIAFDSNSIYLGRVDTSGNVVAENGAIIGKVDYNGEVITSDGKRGFALYDLYVYDNQDNTVGYIAKNGKVYSIMGDIIGTIYNGFVLDKKQNVVARGYRDYTIRDDTNQSIGYLKLDGSVVNTKNIVVGYIEPNGNVIDNNKNVIATAHYLQYYQAPAYPRQKEIGTSDEQNYTQSEKSSSNDKRQNGKEETYEGTGASQAQSGGYYTNDDRQQQGKNGSLPLSLTKEQQEALKSGVPLEKVLKEGAKTGDIQDAKAKEDEQALLTKSKYKPIGIAITPGGKYIGDIYEDGKVINEDNQVVGVQNETGEIEDKEGVVIGKKEALKKAPKKIVNNDWWQKVASGMTVSPHTSTEEITNVGPGGGVGPGGRYNPRRASILAQYHQQRREKLTSAQIQSGYDSASFDGTQDHWGLPRQVSTLRVDMSNMITADKPIPAVLARSLISLGSAPVTAIVERNVYGDSGRNVIIPAGSRVIGGLQEIGDRSRFDGSSGGAKIEISWNRIIRPDGISFMINSAQTGDAQGRGGGAIGYVDEQLVKKYTLPLVGTLVTSAITYMMAEDDENTMGAQVESSKQQAASDARELFMSKMDEIMQEIINSKKQIEPVTYVPAGTRIIIYPMSDLWLRTTKDIENGTRSEGGGQYTNALVGSKNNEGPGTTSTTGNNQQRVVMGNQANNANQQNKGNQPAPLVGNSGGGSNPNQPNNQNRQLGALPPPAADGSDIMLPEEEDESSGEIELDF